MLQNHQRGLVTQLVIFADVSQHVFVILLEHFEKSLWLEGGNLRGVGENRVKVRREGVSWLGKKRGKVS